MLSVEHPAITGHWLRTVSPSPKPPTPASRSATIANAVNQMGNAPVAWACEVGAAMATHIVAVIPEFGGGAVPFETLRMCVESVAIRAGDRS